MPDGDLTILLDLTGNPLAWRPPTRPPSVRGLQHHFLVLLLNIQDQDDHRDLHDNDEAPHMVELDGTIVPRCGAAELGQRLRYGPRYGRVFVLTL